VPGNKCPCDLPKVDVGKFPVDRAGRLERPAATIKRPSWSRLSSDDKTRLLSMLQKAYRHMAAMHYSDPRSLAFQAWLHQYYCCSGPDSSVIPGTVRNIHATSDFLPWHRGFLFFHERIIQGILCDRDFRLPVWDWESEHKAPWRYDPGLLPKNMPGACRKRNEYAHTVADSDLQAWLHSKCAAEFLGQPAPPPPGVSGVDAGNAEQGIHSDVHVVLNGYMRPISSSAVDPVFYAHHANVDRYWELWRSHYHGKHGFAEKWPPWSAYYFYDAFHRLKKPRLVRVTPEELLDLDQLGYCYDCPNVVISDRAVAASRDGSRLFFTAEALATLKQFFGLDLGEASLLRFPQRQRGEFVPARVFLSVPKPRAGRSYYVAIEDLTGARIPIGGFGAFVEEGAATTRFFAPLSLDKTAFGQLWQAIQNSASFQILYAVAKEDVNGALPDPNGRGPIDGPWEPATAGVSFEFLLPEGS
jgi:hypothetical protein